VRSRASRGDDWLRCAASPCDALRCGRAESREAAGGRSGAGHGGAGGGSLPAGAVPRRRAARALPGRPGRNATPTPHPDHHPTPYPLTQALRPAPQRAQDVFFSQSPHLTKSTADNLLGGHLSAIFSKCKFCFGKELD